MSRFHNPLVEWTLILVPLIVIGYFGYTFLFTAPVTPSGLPGNGGFFQVPLVSPLQYTKTIDGWTYTLTSKYAYTLAGKVVGRHEYPENPPDGIIPLDLAVVNGDLISPEILSYFRFSMGAHTLEYSYDIPTLYGLSESYIDEHISNNHLVFLDPALEKTVKGSREGDCLIIKGKLVDIRGSSPTGRYQVDTSTVRNDSYPAGCEIILVESYSPVSCGN